MTPDAGLRGSFRRSAIVHDWLTIPGGSEKVVLELLELLPEAELFTSVYDPARWPALRDHVVHTSFLDRLPAARRHYPKLLPLMNLAFESFDLSRVRPGRLLQPLLRQERADGHRDAARLLLPHAHAPCLGAAPPGRGAGSRHVHRGPHADGPAATRRPGRGEPAGRLRGQLDPRGGADPQALPPRRRRSTSACRCGAPPLPPAPGRRLLPGAGPRGALQEGRAGRGRLRHAGPAREGRRGRARPGRPPAPRQGRAPSSSATPTTPRSTLCCPARAGCCSRARRTSASFRLRPRPPESP